MSLSSKNKTIADGKIIPKVILVWREAPMGPLISFGAISMTYFAEKIQ